MNKFAASLTVIALMSAPLPQPLSSLGLQMAAAQDAEKKRPAKPKTRRSEVLGKAAFQRIEKAQEFMAEEQYEEAFKSLQAVLDGQKFKPYEKAVALQTIGFVHAAKGDYDKTIATFEQAIATGDLPPRVVSDLNYNLAQLYLGIEKVAKAKTLLDGWFALQEKEPGAEPFALKARMEVLLEDYPSAEKSIRTAIGKIEEPRKNWTRLLLSILLQQERYGEARPILEDAVELWPGVKSFWQQLSAVYYDAGEDKLAFVAQQAMHVQNMLVSSKELTTMAQLYLYHNVPIKAALILDKGMRDGAIEKTEKNYELLAQAFMHAREWSQSIAPLTRAAELSDKGKHYRQLAQSHVQDENWAEAEAALVKALNKGGLDDEADSWLLLGISRTRLEKYETAIAAFRKAGEDDDIAKDAYRWIRSIERRLKAQQAG